MRFQPSTDVGGKTINIDTDIMPCLPKGSLAEIVNHMTGQTGAAKLNVDVVQKWLPKVKHSFRGVYGRSGYILPKGISKDRAKANWLQREDLSKGRRFQIHDIRMPDFEMSFDVNDRPMSVHEYFKTCMNHPFLFVLQSTS